MERYIHGTSLSSFDGSVQVELKGIGGNKGQWYCRVC